MWTSASENVQRVLSDLKPNPSFWCKLGIHKWERWVLYKKTEHNAFYSYHEEHMHRRECAHCGKTEFKRTVTPKLNKLVG